MPLGLQPIHDLSAARDHGADLPAVDGLRRRCASILARPLPRFTTRLPLGETAVASGHPRVVRTISDLGADHETTLEAILDVVNPPVKGA